MATTTGQLDSLAAAGAELVGAATLDVALTALARAAGAATAATAVAIRVPAGDHAVARGLWCSSPALQAELEGTRSSLADRHGGAEVLVVPVEDGERVLVAIELLRPGGFSGGDRAVAEIAAHQAALLVRAFESEGLPANGALTATLVRRKRAAQSGLLGSWRR
jgi:hypothetical protein